MAPITTGFAPVNGLDLYYEIYGQGAPLVLIHGGGSTIASNWGHFIPLLAPHRQLIAVELAAHGHTKDRGTPTTFEQDADDVAGLLQFLHISKAAILGFSNGGNTAMQLAMRHPELVEKLIIASSFYKREGLFDGFWDFMANASLDNMPKPLQEAYLAINNDPRGLETMHNRDRDRMLAFVSWTDEMMQQITASTLLVVGDHDAITVEHTVEMYRVLPQAQLVVLPGGHGEYLGECTFENKGGKLPGIAAALMLGFLDQ